jgi:hypothetical protein
MSNALPSPQQDQAEEDTHRGTLLIAAISLVVSAVAFFELPYSSFGLLSVTAPQTIEFLSYMHEEWRLVLLAPLATVVSALVAGSQYLVSAQGRKPNAAAVGFTNFLSGLLVLTYLANIAVLGVRETRGSFDFDPSVLESLGSGFWVGLAGVAVAWLALPSSSTAKN